MISYAQNFEDVILWRAFSTVESGFYIDIGAQHPVLDSVSLAFYEAGWRGLHVEPMEEYARLIRAARPDEDVLEAAVGFSDENITFYGISGTGLSTGQKVLAEQHERDGFGVEVSTVPAVRLGSLLDRYADRPIHWLKIDVEGMESDVINSWQPSDVRPWIVVVESYAPKTRQPTFPNFEPQLESLGYRFAHDDGLNRFYCHADHSDLLDRLRAPPNCFDPFQLSPFVQGFRWSAAAIAKQRRELDDNRRKHHALTEAAGIELARKLDHLSELIEVRLLDSEVCIERERLAATSAIKGLSDARLKLAMQEATIEAHRAENSELSRRVILAERELEAADQQAKVQAESLRATSNALAGAKQQIAIAQASARENFTALQIVLKDPLWKAVQPIKRLKRSVARTRRRLFGKAKKNSMAPAGVQGTQSKSGGVDHQFPNRLLPPASPLQILAEKISADLKESVNSNRRV